MSDETNKRKFHAPPRRLPARSAETAEPPSIPKTKPALHIAQGNDTQQRIQQPKNVSLSQAHQDSCTVETSESYQMRAPSGSPKKGSPTIPLLREAQVSIGAKRPLDCNQGSGSSGSPKNGSPTIPLLLEAQASLGAESQLNCNQGSGSTTGILEKEANVKRTSLYKPKCSWGLIWKKKNLDLNAREDFISRNVILNGWYHADAVGLDEKNISNLVGFKCCQCRRIRQPTCPYLGRKSRRVLEVKKLQVKASKLDNLIAGPCPDSVQDQNDLLPTAVVKTPHTADDIDTILSKPLFTYGRKMDSQVEDDRSSHTSLLQ